MLNVFQMTISKKKEAISEYVANSVDNESFSRNLKVFWKACVLFCITFTTYKIPLLM